MKDLQIGMLCEVEFPEGWDKGWIFKGTTAGGIDENFERLILTKNGKTINGAHPKCVIPMKYAVTQIAEIHDLSSGDPKVYIVSCSDECKGSTAHTAYFEAVGRQETVTMGKVIVRLLYSGYISGHRKSGIKVGDAVKVVRTAKSYEGGWGNTWEDEMSSLVDEDGIVTEDNGKDGFTVSIEDVTESGAGPSIYGFPYFVIERL